MLARIITGLVIICVMLLAIIYLPVMYFAAFCAVILAVAANEWVDFMGASQVTLTDSSSSLLRKQESRSAERLASDAGTGSQIKFGMTKYVLKAIYFILLIAGLALSWRHLQLSVTIGAAFWLCAILLTLSPMTCTTWLSKTWAIWLCSLLALVPAWAAIVMLDKEQLHLGVFYVILITACSDTFAYFVGRLIGKHKMAPNLSPKKTIEGAVGGILIAALVTTGFVYLVHEKVQLGFWQVLLISLVLCIVSIFGDLFESLFKRQCQVKDSGTILPGHGGVLDRIDSIIAVLPVFAFVQIVLPIFQYTCILK